jgi:predicted PurR-regulated permease PerM
MSDSDPYIARSLEVFVRLGLVVALVVWCFLILQPFITTIIWGMIIAVALLPLFTWILKKTNWSRGRASTIMTLLLLALLITPSVEFSRALVVNASELATDIDNRTLQVPPAQERVKEWPVIGEKLYEGWDLFNRNLEGALGEYQEEIAKASRWVLAKAAGAGLGVLQFVLSIIIAGVFLAYSESSGEFARKLGRRLAGEPGENYADLMSATIRGVAQGVLGVAFIQAFLAGIGFMVMGIPAAGLWTLLVLMLAIVQISPMLVLVPTVIYVFSGAETVPAVLYMIWALSVGFLDNILKPILLARGVPVPMAVIFLGAIGGFILSGFVGLFVGAVIIVMGYELFTTWLNVDADHV